MDDTLHGFRQFKIDNIHNEKETNHTASTLYGYINMPMVNTIYGYQDSELNHMEHQWSGAMGTGRQCFGEGE